MPVCRYAIDVTWFDDPHYVQLVWKTLIFHVFFHQILEFGNHYRFRSAFSKILIRKVDEFLKVTHQFNWDAIYSINIWKPVCVCVDHCNSLFTLSISLFISFSWMWASSAHCGYSIQVRYTWRVVVKQVFPIATFNVVHGMGNWKSVQRDISINFSTPLQVKRVRNKAKKIVCVVF